ncbi:UNVERIFIED_CONTAM: hypothetical protein HDU68_000401 [Siphonaria sp. JEL0065]|nr:hypothetical protein HDU68_000401 [Siphonaria sp. JEL0065]
MLVPTAEPRSPSLSAESIGSTPEPQLQPEDGLIEKPLLSLGFNVSASVSVPVARKRKAEISLVDNANPKSIDSARPTKKRAASISSSTSSASERSERSERSEVEGQDSLNPLPLQNTQAKRRRSSDSSVNSNLSASSTTSALKHFKLGSRLLAHSHAQITKLLLQIVERRSGDPEFEQDLLDLLPCKVDHANVETEIKESLSVLNKMLPPIRPNDHNQNSNHNNSNNNNSNSNNNASPRDSSWFRKSSGALTQIRTIVLKHSQNILEAQMYRDYVTFFAPLALSTAENLPHWDDPKNNKLQQAIYRRIASGLKTSVGKIKVIGVLDGDDTNAATTCDIFANGGVLKEELETLVRTVKSCRGFNEELGEFRGVLEAVEMALDQTSM